MLAYIRRFAKTWPARALFFVLVAAFGLWGVAGRLTNPNGDTAVAHVAGMRVEAAELQRAYARQMAQLAKQNGAGFQPTAQMRSDVAHQAAQQLVLQALVTAQMKHLGLVVPDAAVRDETFALPAFKGMNGQFDRQTFLSVLARNSLDEASFIDLIRGDLGRQELTGAIGAGFAAPRQMTNAVFATTRETRTAQAVSLPIAAAGDVPAPTDAQLRRFWTNNPSLYATPEYRRIKAIVLSAQTLSHDMQVSDQDIKNFYALTKSTYDKPEKRSVQIISANDQAAAARLATAWQGGLDWTGIQALAKAAGATALDFPNAKKAELPDAGLAAMAFAAQPNDISPPIKGDFAWFIVKVTTITPGSLVTLDQARDAIRQKIAIVKANDAMDDHLNKLEDALAGGGALDALPQGLGIAAVEGTLDAQGNTPTGEPAPLPAYPALRTAIIAAAFKARPNDEPQLLQLAPDKENVSGAAYALQVESITKPSQLAYDAVTARVRQDWTHAQLRHAQETKAAALLGQVHAGHTLAAAAAAQGQTVFTLPPIPRPIGDSPAPPGVPPTLVAPLFDMKPGEATMIETPDGFMVAALTSINVPDIAADPIGADQLRSQLTQSIATDASNLFIEALEKRFKVTLNETVIQQIAKP